MFPWQEVYEYDDYTLSENDPTIPEKERKLSLKRIDEKLKRLAEEARIPQRKRNMNKPPLLRLYKGQKNFLSMMERHDREDLAVNGQHPYAIVICCSDSRVIPEEIFYADAGELFVIRVAGNVLDEHALGSVEYAVAHLHCKEILILGHTGCGAVGAALSGGGEGYIKSITDDILKAVGEEKDPYEAVKKNVLHGMETLKNAFEGHLEMEDVDITGAVFDIRSGEIDWLDQQEKPILVWLERRNDLQYVKEQLEKMLSGVYARWKDSEDPVFLSRENIPFCLQIIGVKRDPFIVLEYLDTGEDGGGFWAQDYDCIEDMLKAIMDEIDAET